MKVTAKGTFERSLRYVSLGGIPKSLAAARASLTVAPSIPASTELQVHPGNFSGAHNYDVYSAPSRQSVRGANGRAKVSTNAWIQVFGTEGDWVLVHYSIDASHYRFGYISASSLPRNADVPALNFTRTTCWTSQAVSLTDDPLYSRSPLASLPAGAQVTWLASMGDWAYVEVTSPSYARGFVPIDAVNHNRAVDLRTQRDYSGRTVFDGTITLNYDNRVEAGVAIAADGPLAGLDVSSIQVTNGTTGDLQTAFWPGADGRFYGAFDTGGSFSSATLTAVGTDGKILASVLVSW